MAYALTAPLAGDPDGWHDAMEIRPIPAHHDDPPPSPEGEDDGWLRDMGIMEYDIERGEPAPLRKLLESAMHLPAPASAAAFPSGTQEALRAAREHLAAHGVNPYACDHHTEASAYGRLMTWYAHELAGTRWRQYQSLFADCGLCEMELLREDQVQRGDVHHGNGRR